MSVCRLATPTGRNATARASQWWTGCRSSPISPIAAIYPVGAVSPFNRARQQVDGEPSLGACDQVTRPDHLQHGPVLRRGRRERAGRGQHLSGVAGLDRDRPLVRIYPMMTTSITRPPRSPFLRAVVNEAGQRCFEQSRPFLSHASPWCPPDPHAMKEPLHDHQWDNQECSREESAPVGTYSRLTGQPVSSNKQPLGGDLLTLGHVPRRARSGTGTAGIPASELERSPLRPTTTHTRRATETAPSRCMSSTCNPANQRLRTGRATIRRARACLSPDNLR
jgi:hypothetical protein